MIAFHFPPLSGSSGIQRSLRFARYLPEFGWDPIVLTVRPSVYEQTDQNLLSDVPASLQVHRTLAFDTARHFAIKNKYPSVLARPDRWISWSLTAVPAGLGLARRLRPSAIWSTYPIATAHAIGSTLHRCTGLPWLADFRDPMAQEGYPADPAVWRSFKRIEAGAMAAAKFSVFTTRGAASLYRDRYPAHAMNVRVIENGFDEEAFAGLPAWEDAVTQPPYLLVHSGIVYPSERDPSKFFAALRALRRSGRLSPRDLLVRFRAPVHEDLIHRLAAEFEIQDFIEVAPALPYRDALREMCVAAGLLVLQAANCNQQIPAKLYEYLRAGRPILGLADPVGDTAQALSAAGVRHIAALEDQEAMETAIERFVNDLRTAGAASPDVDLVRRASRRERTRELAALLDRAIER